MTARGGGARNVSVSESASHGHQPLVELRGVTRTFAYGHGRDRRIIPAVRGISLAIHRAETLALVGESGCGKSTTGSIVMRLLAPDSGRVLYDGVDVTGWQRRRMRSVRSQVQMVFQDPYSSLNPRMSVRDLVSEPLRVLGSYGRRSEVAVREMLARVGLDPHRYVDRRPDALSGGQRQRVGIARALIVNPRVLVLDEPVASLDASVQAQILNLFADLQDELGVSYLFIAHDLSVVRHLASRVAVMYMGAIVETGDAKRLFSAPEHPYTHALLSAIPIDHPRDRGSGGGCITRDEAPDPGNLPSGCAYRTRCYQAKSLCAISAPALPSLESGAACHYPVRRGLADLRRSRNMDPADNKCGKTPMEYNC